MVHNGSFVESRCFMVDWGCVVRSFVMHWSSMMRGLVHGSVMNWRFMVRCLMM